MPAFIQASLLLRQPFLDGIPALAGRSFSPKRVVLFSRNGRSTNSEMGGPFQPSRAGRFPVDYLCAVFDAPQSTKDMLQDAFGVATIPLQDFQYRAYGLHAIGAWPSSRLAGLDMFVAPAGDDLVNFTALGSLVDDGQASLWASQGAVVRPSAASTNTVASQLSNRTLIGATGHQCGETLLRGSPGYPMLIWVAKPNSLPDALHYWNTRAMIPLRLSTMKSCILTPVIADESYLSTILVSAALSNPYPLAPDVLLFSQTVPVAQREEFARSLGFEIFTEPKPQRDPLGRGRPDRPISAIATWDPLQFVFAERVPGQRVSVLTLIVPEQTIIRTNSSVEFNGRINGEVRARFSGTTQFKLPPGRSFGPLFQDVAVVNQGVVEIQTETNHTYEFRLRVPAPVDLLRASLGERGISIELSDKGSLAQGTIQLARDTRLFRNNRVRQIIESLTTHRYERELQEARAQVGRKADLESLVARLQEVRQEARTAQQIAGWIGNRCGACSPRVVTPILSQLVDGGLVVRGLKIDCDLCRFPSFVELERVRAPMPCPACGADASFVPGPSGEPSLHYRLNALLDRASDNGVLGHLVGMAAILQESPSAFVMPGVNLQLPGIARREADLLALVEGEIGIGEAKTSAGWFTDQQLTKDLQVATAVGAVVYLMVCLEPPLDSDFKKLATRRCAKAGLRCLCVEGAEGPLTRLA